MSVLEVDRVTRSICSGRVGRVSGSGCWERKKKRGSVLGLKARLG